MCILFMYVANQTGSSSTTATTGLVSRSPYKLILASNRDENLFRPTKSAYFWDNPEGESHILAGQDLEEMGTWLGISKRGKLAVLLNIMGADTWAVKNKAYTSRGSLVTGFLRSPPGLPGCTYLKNLCHLDISANYRPYQLVTVDIFGTTDETGVGETTNCNGKHLANDNSSKASTANPASSICVNYLAHQNKNCGKADSKTGGSEAFNEESSSSQPKHMGPPANTCKFYAFGNSVCDRPFKKVACGRKEFEEIVLRLCADRTDEESLVQELVLFLKSTEQYYPDEVIDEHAKGSKIPTALLPNFGSRFVSLPGSDYGTRTHTIVLVDMQNNVIFHEFTMKSPVNTASPEWSHEKFTFPLTFESS